MVSMLTATSKGGCHALARNMAGELAPLGIRVNVVVPGFHRHENRMPTWSLDREQLTDAERLIPLGRIGRAG